MGGASRGEIGITLGYLTDVYDTPAAFDSPLPPPYAFAHHTHLAYDGPSLAQPTNETVVWRATHLHMLSRVDVSSSRTDTPKREQYARYYFDYDQDWRSAYLRQVTQEGHCATAEGDGGMLPFPGNASCAKRAPIKFSYLPAPPKPSVVKVGPIMVTWAGQIPTIMDVNGDGLPDFVARPGTGNETQPLLLNSVGTQQDEWTSTNITFVNNAYGAGAALMNPSFPAFNEGNFLGNGKVNVLWFDYADATDNSTDMSYALYSPTFASGRWVWNGGAAGSLPFLRRLNYPSVWNYGKDFRYGEESKYGLADLDGDGFQDLLTTVVYGKAELDKPNSNDLNVHYKDARRELEVRKTERKNSGEVVPFVGDDWANAELAPIAQTICIGGANSRYDNSLAGTTTVFNPNQPYLDVLFDKNFSGIFSDLNADGLPDWVRLGPKNLRVWMNHGSTQFGSCNDGSRSRLIWTV